MPKPHRHVASCWSRYEPCGEHHQHDYNCGNGILSRACPERPHAPKTPGGYTSQSMKWRGTEKEAWEVAQDLQTEKVCDAPHLELLIRRAQAHVVRRLFERIHDKPLALETGFLLSKLDEWADAVEKGDVEP